MAFWTFRIGQIVLFPFYSIEKSQISRVNVAFDFK